MQKVLRIDPFSGDALPKGELAALQNLATSYIVELRMFRVIDTEGQEQAMKEAEAAIQLGSTKEIAPLSADYILSARASTLGGLIVFTMELTKVSSGEKRNVADTFASVNELMLATRRLAYGLFDRATASGQGDAPATAPSPSATPSAVPPASATPPAASSAPTAPTAPTAPALNHSPSLAMVAGNWKGDKSIEKVSLMSDGRGQAFFSTGAKMKVKAVISGTTIVVEQNQASAPEFYRSSGINLKAAKEIAKLARRWRWIFALSADGNSLIGVKESVFVKIDEKGSVSVDNSYTRDAQWTRLK